jgi:TRAP-type C4-dicarboxylate transport system permease small subunit
VTGKSRKDRVLRNFLIYPKFQLTLIVLNLSVLILALFIFWICAQQMIQNLRPSAALSGIEIEFFRRYLDYQGTQFKRIILMATGVATLSSTIATLVISHRMAGPFVRLKKHLTAIISGERPIPPLSFRDDDYFQELPKLVNDAVSALGEGASRKS